VHEIYEPDTLPTQAMTAPAGVEPAEPAPPSGREEPPLTVIVPTRGWRAVDLREVWRYRELLLFLAWREISVRYKQTLLGAAWAIIQPLMTTGLFAGLFALLMGRGNEPTVPGVPYVVSTFCAMLPWQLFANSISQAGTSLITHQGMIQKIYFPRLILPFSAVLAALVDFAVAFVALLILMLCFGVVPSWAVLTLPVFVALAIIASLSVGLWLSALSAIYRDFRYVIPFIVQLGMFASPVVYATASIRGKLPTWAVALYGLNPMAGVIEGFRWALLGTSEPPGLLFLASLVMTGLLFTGGMYSFRRLERTFADVI
jgi:lipopolysaccharide transport system permease protein